MTAPTPSTFLYRKRPVVIEARWTGDNEAKVRELRRVACSETTA